MGLTEGILELDGTLGGFRVVVLFFENSNRLSGGGVVPPLLQAFRKNLWGSLMAAVVAFKVFGSPRRQW